MNKLMKRSFIHFYLCYTVYNNNPKGSHKMVGTFKIITLATALEEKLIDLDKDTFYDSGSVNIDGARIKCWKKGGHGAETYLDVVKNSCNLGVTTRTFLSSLITP